MIILALLFGFIIGSFLNCMAWRLYHGETIFGRSQCPKCHKQIAWYDNIPILSWLILKAKCRHCHKPISWQYPLVELVIGLLFALFWYVNIGNLGFEALISVKLETWLILVRNLIAVAFLALIFIIDFKWYVILDEISLSGCVIFLIFNLFLGQSWQNLLLAAAVGAGFFLLQFIVSKGKWIGGGDIRLGALMGFLVGWPNILVALFLAYIIGSLVGVGLIVTKRKHMASKLPFGTFLSVATIITILWGSQLAAWYLNLL